MEDNTVKSWQAKVFTVVSAKDTFPARFPNIFVDYPLGSMKVGDKLWTNWNKAPLKLWQTQLNFLRCGAHQVLVGLVLCI